VRTDAFLCGFAAAIACVQRSYREDVIVRDVLISSGITLIDLIRAGSDAFDTLAILASISGCADLDKTARGCSVRRVKETHRK